MSQGGSSGIGGITPPNPEAWRQTLPSPLTSGVQARQHSGPADIPPTLKPTSGAEASRGGVEAAAEKASNFLPAAIQQAGEVLLGAATPSASSRGLIPTDGPLAKAKASADGVVAALEKKLDSVIEAAGLKQQVRYVGDFAGHLATARKGIESLKSMTDQTKRETKAATLNSQLDYLAKNAGGIKEVVEKAQEEARAKHLSPEEQGEITVKVEKKGTEQTRKYIVQKEKSGVVVVTSQQFVDKLTIFKLEKGGSIRLGVGTFGIVTTGADHSNRKGMVQPRGEIAAKMAIGDNKEEVEQAKKDLITEKEFLDKAAGLGEEIMDGIEAKKIGLVRSGKESFLLSEKYSSALKTGLATDKQLCLGFSNMLRSIKILRGQRMHHQDIKPENMLLDEKNEKAPIKLADFGGATDLSDVFKALEDKKSRERGGADRIAGGVKDFLKKAGIGRKTLQAEHRTRGSFYYYPAYIEDAFEKAFKADDVQKVDELSTKRDVLALALSFLSLNTFSLEAIKKFAVSKKVNDESIDELLKCSPMNKSAKVLIKEMLKATAPSAPPLTDDQMNGWVAEFKKLSNSSAS